MISYLGSLVQFSPAAGRAGRCRQISLCVGSTRRVLATMGLPRTAVSVLSPSTLLRLPAALYGAGSALSAVPVFGSSTKARIRLRLGFVSSLPSAVQAAKGLRAFSRAVSGSGSQKFWRPLPGCGLPFPSLASGPGHALPGRGAPFPSAAPARAAGRVSGSL